MRGVRARTRAGTLARVGDSGVDLGILGII